MAGSHWTLNMESGIQTGAGTSCDSIPSGESIDLPEVNEKLLTWTNSLDRSYSVPNLQGRRGYYQQHLEGSTNGNEECIREVEEADPNKPPVDGHQSAEKSIKIKTWVLAISAILVTGVIVVLLALVIAGPKLHGDVVPQLTPPCPKSWIWADGHCYYFSNTSKSWTGSKSYCADHKSTLAELLDGSIANSIKRYKENTHYWVGLRKTVDGAWLWLSGATYNGSIDQDNPNLKCAFLNSHLGALDCTTPRPWICVKKSF